MTFYYVLIGSQNLVNEKQIQLQIENIVQHHLVTLDDPEHFQYKWGNEQATIYFSKHYSRLKPYSDDIKQMNIEG